MFYKYKDYARSIMFVWMMLVGVITFLLIARLDGFFFPVVNTFVVTELKRNPDYLLISGYMFKQRDCKFVSVDATAETATKGEVHVPLRFMDNEIDQQSTRPTGSQGWGPWRVGVPSDTKSITLKSYHSCSYLWTTTTHLLTFNIDVTKVEINGS